MIFWNHAAHAFCFPVKASSQINTFGLLFILFFSPPGCPASAAWARGADAGKSSGIVQGVRKGGTEPHRGCAGAFLGFLRGFWAELQLWFGRNLKSPLMPPHQVAFPFLWFYLGNLLEKSEFSTSSDPSLSSGSPPGHGAGEDQDLTARSLRDLCAAERSWNAESEGGIEMRASFDVEENC